MFTVDADKLRTLMLKRGIFGAYELAKLARLNAATTAKALKDGAKVTIKTLGALAILFGVDVNDLILKG